MKNTGGEILKKDEATLLLSQIKGLGVKKILELDEKLSGVENIFSLKLNEIKSLFSSKEYNIVDQMTAYIKEEKIKYYIEEIQNKKIWYLSIFNREYPEELANIYDPPAVIYGVGKKEKLSSNFKVAIVGSRRASAYGLWAAKKIASDLSKNSATIVSGLAYGIDAQSHFGGLEGEGSTIAVLASSPNLIYPRGNLKLSKKIIEEGGILVSEYPPDTKPIPGYFPRRNRIISGLSKAIIVVEADVKSGALITVDQGLEQGRSIFAVPGNINSNMSKGTNNLIKEGAKLYTSIEDFCEEFSDFTNISNKRKGFQEEKFSDMEKKIIQTLIEHGNIGLEQISFFSKINIKDVQGVLNILEIKGIVIELRNKIYGINKID